MTKIWEQLRGNGVAIESREVHVEEPVEIRPTHESAPEAAS